MGGLPKVDIGGHGERAEKCQNFVDVFYGRNFYYADRLEPPPLFKLEGFQAYEPPLFARM